VNAPAGTGVRTAGPGPGLPAAAARLERELAARHARAGFRAGPGAPRPRVAALGTEDLLAWERRPDGAPGEPRPEHRAANVHVTAQAILIGPWGGAPRGNDGAAVGCGHCLAIRWQRLRPRHERDALEAHPALHAAGAVWPIPAEPLVSAVWHCYRRALLEPVDAPDDAPRSGPSRVTRIDVRTLAVTSGLLLPEPNCPSCGAYAAPSPELALTPRPKPAPNAYRLRHPSDYDLPERALANEVCGVLAPGTSAILGSPTTAPVAGGGLVRGPGGLHELTWSGQANTYADSARLAFLEGFERYAGTQRRRPGVTVDSLESLAARGVAALDPRSCGTYGPAAYETDETLTPFDPQRQVPWVPGYSLRDRRPVLVPFRSAYYGWDGGDEMYVFECSSGCAGGSCLEEAILFGLLELVERDAFLLAWYGGAQLPALDPATAGPAVRAMTDRARLQGYQVRLFDNRIDLRIPVVTAVAARLDGGPGLFSFAAGAGLDPRAAAQAALGEILTYLPALPRQVRARRAELDRMADDYSLVRALPDHAALFGLPRMAQHARRYTRAVDPRPLDEAYRGWTAERPATGDLADDVRFCVGELAQAGFDVIVVDQTTGEQRAAGLSSVRVIVPGLVPIDFGWPRQRALRLPRMLTALRRAGLRDADLTPDQLHLVPHPFP
jgi:ribosomal protein S12 methylthiotransferase accessory factor